jgi:hypothetical protein
VAEAAAMPGTTFKAAHAASEHRTRTVKACLDGLGAIPEGANFGFVYATGAVIRAVTYKVAYPAPEGRCDSRKPGFPQIHWLLGLGPLIWIA